MSFDRSRVPGGALRTGGKYSWLNNGRRTNGKGTRGDCIRKKDIVSGALINTSHIKLADIQAAVNSRPIKRAIATTGTRQNVSPGCQKICRSQTCPSVRTYSLQSQSSSKKTLANVKISVIAPPQRQPGCAVVAARQRHGIAGVVIFGVTHQLDAELVFTQAGALVDVGVANRNKVIELIRAAHIGERHHALFGKR